MNHLRLATAEEVEKIRLESDLDETCKVLALDTAMGTPIAVLRMALETDPCFYPEGFGAKQIAMFSRDLLTYLWAQNFKSLYFNVNPADTNWIEHLKAEGCEQVSKQPELRFKRTI
jgi:hypothetical protein